MTYSPLLTAHIAGGIFGVVSGTASMMFRKGSRRHRAAGNAFVVSMLVMASSGALLALLRSQPANVLGGVLTLYMVATAWLTAKRRDYETGRPEFVLMLMAFSASASALVLAAQRAIDGRSAGPFLVFAAVAMMFGVADLKMLVRGGVAGSARIARHLWRMGLALFIASGSFFLGTASDPVLKRTGLRAQLFTKEVRDTHLPALAVLILVALTLYWLMRVRFGNEYRKPRQDQSQPEAPAAQRPDPNDPKVAAARERLVPQL